MKIILLPGLDGTGMLSKDMIEALPSHLSIEVIALDTLNGKSYVDQAKEIVNRIEENDFFIVAESYSGRIGYELCDLLGEKIKGIMFIASFISSPSFISKFSYFIPVILFKPFRINKWLLKKIGFSSFGNMKLINSVFQSIYIADKYKLKNRLKNIASLKKPTHRYRLPTTYILPSNDKLVSRNAVNEVKDVFIYCTISVIKGGHFIAQLQPEECAKVIGQAVRGLK